MKNMNNVDMDSLHKQAIVALSLLPADEVAASIHDTMEHGREIVGGKLSGAVELEMFRVFVEDIRAGEQLRLERNTTGPLKADTEVLKVAGDSSLGRMLQDVLNKLRDADHYGG